MTLKIPQEVYTVAQYVGLPAEQLVRFLGAAKQCGYELSALSHRATEQGAELAKRQLKDAEAAIDLFLEYRDKYGYEEDHAKAAALNEFSEALSPEVAAIEQQREPRGDG